MLEKEKGSGGDLNIHTKKKKSGGDGSNERLTK